jgi:predicted lipoprotein
MKEWRRVIENGELAEKINKSDEEEQHIWSLFFDDQFSGEKEWETELEEVLYKQLEDLRQKKPKPKKVKARPSQ